MKAQEIQLGVGACSCLLEDPAQGPLRLDVVELSTERAVLGETPLLTADAYVDVALEFAAGPRSQLFAQILPTDQNREEDEGETEEGSNDADTAGPGGQETARAEGQPSPAPRFFLRWVHSDPLGESRLEALINTYVETDGKFDQKSGLEQRGIASAVAANEEEEIGGILVVPDQDAPTPVGPVREPSEEARRSFKFAHLLQGSGDSPKAPRSRRELVIRPPPRNTQATAGGQGDEENGDVSALLRKRAKMVRASDLAARHDRVRVLGESTLRQLLDEAVNEAVEKIEASLSECERERLLHEAEEEFHDRLEAFKAEKAGLESKARVLEDQLDKAQALLEEERQRVVSAEQFTVSDAGMLEIETRLERMLNRAVKKGGVSADLEGEMRDVLSRLLDEERGRISARAQETQSATLELLERKVHRLAKSLEDASRERDSAVRRADALESMAGGGFRNIMTAGLEDDDPNKKKKLGLLKEIFEQNKEMRVHLQKSQESDPGRAQADEPPPVDAPVEGEETQLMSRTPTVVAHYSENADS